MSQRPLRHPRTTRPTGFTLIEVVGAFFLMVVVLVFITGIFVENGRQRAAATELMRERLSAIGTLALVAADLESAILLTPKEGADPQDHPWQFVADDSGEFGATSLKFVTQNAPATNSGENVSSWVKVAYHLEAEDETGWTLQRWLSLRPPSQDGDEFPDSSDDGWARVAIGVSDFGVRFLDSEGNWVDEWDSTYQAPSQMLPEAAEITIELLRDRRRGELQGEETMIPGIPQTRTVTLVMQPIDVAALINLENGGGQETDCFTIGQCLDAGENDWYSLELEDQCGGDEFLCALLTSPDNNCWAAIETSYPKLASLAPESCSS